MSNSQTNQEENALEEALSPIVDKLINKNYESNKERMTSQIAPLLGSAIREQIKSQKDDVVDALYPVLGNMISRYVTKTLEETLNSINAQIQNGLSYKTLKRKVKAKLKGVSETELLLSENANPNIQAVFLIHKETGVTLSRAHNPNHHVSEPEMLAAMMTAIRSFVNDWVSQDGKDHELGEIDYSGNKIIIEASSYSYLAVIVEGASYNSTYDRIRGVLGNIVSKYGESVKKFNGDLTQFPNAEVYKELSSLLINEEEIHKAKTHPLMYVVPLVFLSWASFSVYKNYLNDALRDKANEVLYKTTQLTSYRLTANAVDGVITLSGEVPFAYHKRLARKLVEKLESANKVDNQIIVAPSLEDPMRISSNIAYLISGLNSQKGVNLTYDYDYETLVVKGEVWDEARKNRVMQVITQAITLKNMQNAVIIKPPELHKSVCFERGSTKLTPSAQSRLIETILLLKRLDESLLINVTSYSDQIGEKKQNKKLSNDRIQNVTNYLREQGDVSNEFVTAVSQSSPEGVNPSLEPQKARCVIISYEKKVNR